MKTKWIIPASALIGTLLPLPALCADRLDDKNFQARDHESKHERLVATSSQKELLSSPVRVTELVGQEVLNLRDEKLGSLSLLGIDIESGRIPVAVIESGGVFGLGSKNIAVPPQVLSYDGIRKVLKLDMDQDALKNAPAFDTSKWDQATRQTELLETYRYYHQEPYFKTNTTPKEIIPNETASIEKSSKVIGLPVLGPGNEKYGKVENLVVDLPSARIVHVVVSSGGFLGIGDALNAIPPTEFHYSPGRDALVLNVSKASLSKAPHFKSTEWPDFNNGQYSGLVYESYGVEPFFRVDVDNTGRNVRDRQGTQLTPLDQGSNESDVQITREIRRTIRNQKELSVNAHNVKIITVKGRVTLRGPVKDPTEKQAIEAIARRVVRSDEVDNQLEVKNEPLKE